MKTAPWRKTARNQFARLLEFRREFPEFNRASIVPKGYVPSQSFNLSNP